MWTEWGGRWSSTCFRGAAATTTSPTSHVVLTGVYPLFPQPTPTKPGSATGLGLLTSVTTLVVVVRRLRVSSTKLSTTCFTIRYFHSSSTSAQRLLRFTVTDTACHHSAPARPRLQLRWTRYSHPSQLVCEVDDDCDTERAGQVGD